MSKRRTVESSFLATAPSGEEATLKHEQFSRRDVMVVGLGSLLAGLGLGKAFPDTVETSDSQPDTPPKPDGRPPKGAETEVPENPEELNDFEVFLSKYESVAMDVQDKYQVPYEVTLAMGMLESGYGASELANNAYNFHGLKANSEWSGAVYEKETLEQVPEDRLDDWDYRGEPVLVEDGVYEIRVTDKFKAFISPEAGFHGFGEHLRTRFDGEAYRDAFEHTDPYAFVSALFDTEGARYATDVRYLEKVLTILNKMTGKNETLPTSDLEMRDWSELNDKERRQFGNKDEYIKTVEQLSLTVPTSEGYDEFMASVEDISEEVSRMDGVKRVLPSEERLKLVEMPRITIHYTAWPESAWSHDGRKFMSSVINTEGRVSSANLYLSRDGKKLYLLTAPDRAAFHAGSDEYNGGSIGLEVPAGKQSDIPPGLYEGIVYTVARQYRQYHGKKKPTQQEMRKYVIGHGEIAELRPGVSNHRDFPRAAADAVADIAWQLLQKI